MYKLSKVDPPELPAENFEYYNEPYKFELKRYINSYGGVSEYIYDTHNFYFNDIGLITKVLSIKYINGNVWSYTYPEYENRYDRTVTVDGPLYDTKVIYYAHTSDTGVLLTEDEWTTGLIQEKWVTDGSYSEYYEWDPQIISNVEWQRMGFNIGKIRAPLKKKIIVTREGDCESSEEFLYERSNVKQYGLPTKIKYYGGSSGTTLQSYKTLQYYFESNTTFLNKYMFNYLKNEKTYSSGGSKLKETETAYYTSTGKCGAVDWIKRWKEGSVYLTWNHDYSSSYARDITITIDLPGSGAGTETYKYSYGVLSELKRPGYTEFTRSISTYNSAILSETNQHGGTMSFTYDDLNRVKKIVMPSGFNDINYAWSTNYVTVTHGGNKVIKYWDNMGRDTGYTESGEGTTLYFRKNLDAEGRVTAENKGSNSASDEYKYVLNAAGKITRITDPREKITNISYSGDNKTVADPEGHSTVFSYTGLPGLATQLKDAYNRVANYTYDGIGRLTQANYNNARTQSYYYNGLDQVNSESHPETGSISYEYNTESNLSEKTMGGVTITYSYNSSNQLKEIVSSDETINYSYDPRGRVIGISSSNGWQRNQISYNDLGSITSETQTIPGLVSKTTSYDYDSNNNLKSITYPDGKTVNYTNNDLNMPEKVTFNGYQLVYQIAYGINKQPTSMNISGNYTTFNASYEDNGLLSFSSLKKGGSYHYKASYGYDDVGNITSFTGTVPNLNANYGYDNLYRLTSASYTGDESFYYTYDYDYYGNLETAKKGGSIVFDRSYNSNNQVNSIDFDYDTRGNMTKAPGFLYEWDRKNRLDTVKRSTGETISNHLYNESGLRLKASRLPSASITVTSPAAGEIWSRNGTYSIAWTITGSMDEYVKILLYQGGVQVLEIVSSTENNGLYDWTIPITVQTGEYSILVQTVDDEFSGESEPFTISGTVTLNQFTEITSGEIVSELSDSTSSCWGDYDNNNFIDLFVTNFSQQNFLYNNNGNGTFNKVINGYIVTDYNNSQNGCWGDYDNDGDLDLFVANYDENNSLYRNNGDGTFYKVTSGYIVSNRGKSFGCVWGDFDNDGNVDLYVGNYNENNFLYNNNGDGTFTRITNGGIVTDSENSMHVSCCDYDNDGDLDIFVSNYNEDNSLYRNNGDWTFTKITSGNIVNDIGKSFASAWGDYDNDGDFDLFVNNREEENNFLYINDGDGTFTKINEGDFVTDGGNSYGCSWGDFDNDGDLDLFVLNANEYNFLYQNNGDGTFTKITTTAIIFNEKNSRNLSWGDYDKDGDLDLFYANYSDNNSLYQNDGNSNSWIIIKCEGVVSNRPGIGAKVKVKATINGSTVWQMREINEKQGLMAGFGLGDAGIINEIIVEWPSGIVQTLNNISVNQYLTITEPEPDLITITSPNGGETLEVGAAHNITWTSTGNIGNVKIEYSIDSGNNYTIISTSTENDGIFEWTIPDDQSSTCLIRISEIDGETVDVSDSVFSIVDGAVSTITVIYPNGGESLEIGSSQNITWTSSGSVGMVKIEYSTDNGIIWTEIVSSTENSGSYNWTVPDNSSDNCLIRISEIDGDPSDMSDGVFSIVPQQSETITVTSPNGGEIWEVGTIHDITWTTTGFIGNVKIEYSADNGNSWADIVAYTGNDGTYIWTVPDSPSDNCLIRISDNDGSAQDTSDSVFSITAASVPTIIVISPNGGESLEIGSSQNITWTSTGTIGMIKIEYSINNGTTWMDIVSSTSNDGSYPWTVPDNQSENCLIRISEIDGEPVDSSDSVFSIAIPQPETITVTSPNGGESWEAAFSHNITWTTTGTVGNVKIEYSDDSGTTWTTIVSSTSNDGIYSWIVPDNPSEACLVRVGEIDGDPIDSSDSEFTITAIPSPCGETWISADYNQGIFYDVIFVDGIYENLEGPTFVAVGSNGIKKCSSDGIFWYPQQYTRYDIFRGITFDYRYLIRVKFIAVGYSGVDSLVYRSISCNTWGLAYDIPDDVQFYDVAFGDLGFIAVGNNGNIFRSMDGDSWGSCDSGTSLSINSIIFGGNCYVAVGYNGLILKRGVNDWSNFTSNISDNLNDVTYGNSQFVTVGNNGKILTSPNGEIWTERSSGTLEHLQAVAYGNSHYVAVGTNGVIITSKDGIEWTQQVSGTTKTIYCVCYGNGKFVALGDNVTLYSLCNPEIPAIIVTSPNGGESWEVGSNQNITWTSTGNIDNVKIEYSTDSGSNYTTIIDSTENDGSYNWIVPANISDTCLVRVSEIDGDPSDTSDAAFSIVLPPSITVTSPNGGEHWEIGSAHHITWNSVGSVGDVKIEYSTDNGTSWIDIIDTTENDGIYEWIIPDNPSIHCLVRISETDGSPSDVSDELFSITLPSNITIISPNGGETWEVGSTQSITWSSIGTFENVKIEYSINSGESWIVIIALTANDGSYDWIIPDTPSDHCLVKISESDQDENPPDFSDAEFSIIPNTSSCGKRWLMSNYSGSDIFASVTYGNSLFAAVGKEGAIWTSSDGITWDAQSSDITNDLNGITHGNSTFAAVGNSGVILTSPNGTNWTPQSSGTSNNLRAITYGSNKFVAVGDSGVILTSSDGITWNPQPSNVNNNLYGVAYGNNTFAAVGESGVILTSPNGSNWTPQTSGTSNILRGITYGSGADIFVAVGNSGVILTSPDGIDWNSRNSIISTAILGASYGNNTFVIVGAYGEILTSPDGINWTPRSSGVGNNLKGVVFDDSRFVAVGAETILYSLCGTVDPSITVTSPNGGENWQVGLSHEITWYSTGTVGEVKIEYSTDNGTSWTEITASTPNTGSYNWTVPDEPSESCLIRVSETDGDPLDVSDMVFTITVETEPTITVTSPNGGETLTAGSTHEITWTTTGAVDNVTIKYSTDSGNSWTKIIASTANDGSFDWIVPDTPSEYCLVRISENDDDLEPSDVSDAAFSIDSPLSPTIIITSPNGREILTIGTIHEITWTCTGTVGNVNIEYSTDNGTSWKEIEIDTDNDGTCDWTIPDDPSNMCLVRISEIDESGDPTNVRDISDAVFSIVSSSSELIIVTYPNGGESLSVGSTHKVTWNSTTTVGDVKIEYSIDNGFSWADIAASTENDGQYDWIVPDTPSDTCLVRVSEIDGDPADMSDSVFSIVLPSTITVTSPNGGESWEAGTSQDITWTSTGTVGNVKIEYSIDNGTSWTEIVKSIANNGIYSWMVPDTQSDTCLVRISESDIDEGPSDVCDSVFSITPPSSPAIFVTSPNGGEELTVGSVHEITWTSVGTVSDLKIEYSTDNGTSWIEIIASTNNDGSYEWGVPDNPSDNCLIRVSEAEDGDPQDVSDAIFSIVSISSTITVTSPNGGESLTAGSTHDITWTSTGTIDDVIIEYSTDSGTSWTTIVTSTANNGSFNWTVPDTPSDNCLIQISENDEDRTPSDISDAEFSIVSPSSATITVTSPNGGESLLVGSAHEITWTSTGPIDNVKIEYSTNNGASWKNIVTSTANDNSYDWIVPNVPVDPSNDCLVQISDSDEDRNASDVSDAVFSITSNTSTCGESWLNTNYSGSDTFTSVTYGSSKFAAVGNSGKITTSSNGITWSSRSSGITNDLYGIVYEEAVNRFAAVGSGGVILTSSDGITWETQNSGITNCLRGIAYGANNFVAVGNNGIILTSPDGIAWNAQSSGITQNLCGIVYGYADNTFAAVGDSGIILTSPDGTNWTTQSSGTSKTLRGITYGGDTFLAVGASGAILTSPNGIIWNSRTSSITTNFKGAACGNGTFVIVGNDGKIVTSNDLIVWKSRSSGVRNNLAGIVFYNSKFVAVGNLTIIYSPCQEQGAGGQNTLSLFMEKYRLDYMPGDVENENKDQNALLRLISPNGDEIMNAGENFLITWKSERYIENIKLEYSPDNGSTYLTIKDRIPNMGYYEWQVPHHISPNCLVKVSNSDGVKPE